MKQYGIIGGMMINDIEYTDGSIKTGLIGGGGLYALTGIKLWTDDVLYIGCVGEDFKDLVGPWWDKNELSRDGLNICHKHCIYHKVDYLPDGRFTEYSIYEEGLRHDVYMYYRPEMIEPFAENLKGLSIVGWPNPVEFKKFGAMREKYGFTIMLELNTGYCKSEYLKDLMECLPYIDMYSVNRPEAMSLFSVETEEECIEKMIEIGKPCFFRVGRKGSYMIMNGEAVFVPIVVGDHDIDPTGCGNSSTAAALYAFTEGYNAKEIGIISNVTSCMNAQDFGPMKHMDKELRQKAWDMVNALNNK